MLMIGRTICTGLGKSPAQWMINRIHPAIRNEYLIILRSPFHVLDVEPSGRHTTRELCHPKPLVLRPSVYTPYVYIFIVNDYCQKSNTIFLYSRVQSLVLQFQDYSYLMPKFRPE
jgi:hypothetical protein